MSPRRFIRSDRGNAGVEFALVLPMLIVLMFGGFEAGNFVWNEHKLVEAVRDGARFASRYPVSTFCDGERAKPATDATYADAVDVIKFYTRTGRMPGSDQQANAAVLPRVPNWTSDSQVTFDPGCGKFVRTGIYGALTNEAGDAGQAGPLASISASVPYRSLFHGLGFPSVGIVLRARSNVAVIGL
ncbi:TadE/TadG family type IV pilus assembly protein [Novosphingobium sp. ZN18A2]|uniref:TadE/TadG family type IV pilus assembly protein n=1 Tax=Novosphingobium sp. ZN18A2 TaxID=3079861 RepID=UPI0030CCACFE